MLFLLAQTLSKISLAFCCLYLIFFLIVLVVLVVSGEVPEDPVVSKKSGLLFERRLIERYIQVRFHSFPLSPLNKKEELLVAICS
jgi:hypothetical protein